MSTQTKVITENDLVELSRKIKENGISSLTDDDSKILLFSIENAMQDMHVLQVLQSGKMDIDDIRRYERDFQ